jgi:hypothetical protein
MALPAGWEIAELQVPAEWQGLAIDNLPPAVLSWMAPLVVEHQDGDVVERLAATQELVLQEGWRIRALCRSDELARWRSGGTAAAAEAD